MSILSTNKKLINIGKEYSAGSGIDITNDVISVIGNTVPYSAGENIDIQDFVISSKDWSNDITDASANAYNETTAWVHDNYTNSADVSFLSAEVDKKLDSSAWEAISGSLATEDYVILSDNLNYARATAFTTSQGYAKESACNSAFDYLNQNKLDVSAFDLPNSGHWNEATNVVETNSAAWFDNVGDAEVNSFVYTNSSTILDVDSTYQANSASYLTAHQDISNKLDTTAFSTVSSDFLTAINIPESANWNDTTNVVQTNSADWASHQDLSYISGVVDNKLDESAFANVSGTFLTAHQDLSDYQTIEGMTAYQHVGDYYSASNPSGFITGVDLTPYATTAEVNNLSSILSGAIDYVSANAGGGSGVISSYTVTWSPDVPPYGSNVINSLNGLYISSFRSNYANGAGNAANANYANSAGSASTVNVDYVENQGFVRNLSSEYGTISVIHNNLVESTNSAILRTGYEGFVSSFGTMDIGPYGKTATFSWDKSLPNTKFTGSVQWPNSNTTIHYSADTNLTGEILAPHRTETTFSIDIPNVTALNFSADQYIAIANNVASAADIFETTVGELAWASALPSYEYDSTNKISAINGSAIAAGDEFPASANEAITAYQTNSGTYLTAISIPESATWNDVSETVQTNSASWTGTNLSGCVKYTDATLSIGSSNTTDNLGNNKGVFAQGISNTAILDGFAQGERNSAYNSLAQGFNNKSRTWSLAQGRDNTAQNTSLAQGNNNTANDIGLAQGEYNNASVYSIAQGERNSASNHSQAFGLGTNANNSGMAIGTFNKTDSAAFVVGNGTSYAARSDAFIVYHDGSVSAAGKISANGVELGAGAEIVNHDNTLSGNGTVDSPLGLNNETVLWKNNGTFSAKGLTAGFSEPASAFERLMFVCGTDTHSKNCSVVEYHPGSASISWPEFYSNSFRYWQTTFNINDTGMTAGPGFFCQWTYSTATNAWSKGNTDWQYNYQGIKKVIGINRKAQ